MFIVADVVNGGGNFPVERPSDIEEYQSHHCHQQKAECELRCRRRHCSRSASNVFVCVSERGGRERERDLSRNQSCYRFPAIRWKFKNALYMFGNTLVFMS